MSVPPRVVLDRYRLDDRIATGGSAQVWRARDTQLERDVAVKLLHPHLLPDERSRARLAAEARAVAALEHPGIVGIYDVDTTGERPAVVFELVDGESLAARIARDGPLPAEEVARIGADVADALFHAHQRGLIHRDVKPGNILLDGRGRPRLVDFGIAHSLEAAAERLTLTGTIVGTARYMAPEQLADGRIGPRTDLYGLGVALYEALEGRPPWESASPVAVAEAQRAGPPPMRRADPALARLVAQALAFDPDERPRTAAAFAAALREWQPTATAAAVAPEAPTAVTSAVTARPSNPAPRRIERGAAAAPAASARPVVAAAVVIGLAALIVVAGLGGQLPAAPADGTIPAATATPSATAIVEPAPAEPALDVDALPPPIREEVEKYLEECGGDAPLPEGIGSMSKKLVEETLKPLREACEKARD